jgi:hypothetical protein
VLDNSISGATTVTNAATHMTNTVTNALSFSGFTRTTPAPKNTQTPDEVMAVILLHLTSTATAAPNSATISAPLVEADSLHELDR